MPYLTLLIVICCAVLYYRVGESDYGSGALLSLASVALWVIGLFLFKFGWLENLLLQIILFFGLSLRNMRRMPPK